MTIALIIWIIISILLHVLVNGEITNKAKKALFVVLTFPYTAFEFVKGKAGYILNHIPGLNKVSDWFKS